MEKGLSLKFSGQASSTWSVCLSRLLIFAKARGLRFFCGDATVMAQPGVLGRKYQKRERDIDRD